MTAKATREPKELSDLVVPFILKAAPAGRRSGKNIQFVETMANNVGAATFGGDRELKMLEELAINIGITNLVFTPGKNGEQAMLESVAPKTTKKKVQK